MPNSGKVSLGARAQVFLKSVELLVELASLQTAFLTLDEAIKTTNRRVNALDNVVRPKLENTISYIKARPLGCAACLCLHASPHAGLPLMPCGDIFCTAASVPLRGQILAPCSTQGSARRAAFPHHGLLSATCHPFLELQIPCTALPCCPVLQYHFYSNILQRYCRGRNSP